MPDLRTKIAALTIALGLGGLGGYAMSSNKAHQGAAATPTEGTKVIRRTIHVKPHHAKAAGPPHPTAGAALASAPVAPVSTGSSGASSGSSVPVHTGSSGSGGSSHPVSTGSSGAGGGGGEDRGEHEGGD